MSFEIKEILDVNIPENLQHLQVLTTGFNNNIRKLKNQFPSFTFTKAFLLPSCHLEKEQPFAELVKLLVSMFKERCEQKPSLSQ